MDIDPASLFTNEDRFRGPRIPASQFINTDRIGGSWSPASLLKIRTNLADRFGGSWILASLIYKLTNFDVEIRVTLGRHYSQKQKRFLLKIAISEYS